MKTEKPDREQMILEFVEWYQGENRRPPTVREIQNHCGFKSPRAVTYFLEKLESAKKIIRHAHSRGIFVTEPERPPQRMFQIPLFPSIPAGGPDALAGEGAPEQLSISPAGLGIRNPAKAFAVRVRGESMVGAGLLTGDIVVLEPKEARAGDIVAALIDGESTLKRFVAKGEKKFLKAENPAYPDLHPVESLAIQGVVVSVIRRLN